MIITADQIGAANGTRTLVDGFREIWPFGVDPSEGDVADLLASNLSGELTEWADSVRRVHPVKVVPAEAELAIAFAAAEQNWSASVTAAWAAHGREQARSAANREHDHVFACATQARDEAKTEARKAYVRAIAGALLSFARTQ